MTRNPSLRALASAVLLLVAAVPGCGTGGRGYNSAVEGVVTLDGRPLVNVTVTFVPKGDGEGQPPASVARTDEQGRFQLQCKRNGSAEEPGAVLGTHEVLVADVAPARTNRNEDPDAKAAVVASKRVPSQYGVPGKTPLTVEVTAETHDYPLALKTR